MKNNFTKLFLILILAFINTNVIALEDFIFESKSIEFKKIMNFLRENPKDCQIKENRGKLSFKKEGIMEINQALELFNKLMSQEA